MSEYLQLPGPAITLFGERDELDRALGMEFERRGCSTHLVTTSMGWLSSTTHAVIRVGTPPGDRAMDGLVNSELPTPHVVAVCQTQPDAAEATRIKSLLDQSHSRHGASLICHGPLDVEISAVGELATAIADQIFEASQLARA
jgi:hypothetical protein